MFAMTIYIEYAIADNLIMDYLLLKGSAQLLKLRTNKFFIFLSALIGTAFAVVFPLLNIAEIYAFLLKIACAALMCLTAARHRSVKDYFFHFNVFLLITFVAGGAVYGILFLTGINYSIDTYYQAKALPVGITILLAYLFVVFIKSITKKIVDGAITVCGLIDCDIVIKGIAFKVKAFYDSGNFLEDKKTGLPVVIADKKTFKKISEKTIMVKRGDLPIVSAGSRFSLPIYKIDYVRIKLKKHTYLRDAVLAVSDNMSGISGADVLIGKGLAGGAVNAELY